MTSNTIPIQSYLTEPVVFQNFAAQQSASLAASSVSSSVTFSSVPGALRVTAKIRNTSAATGAYLAFGTASATAQVSTLTPAGNCDYFAPGKTQIQDFPAGTNTFAAITTGSNATLEISVGYGN